MLSRYFVQVSTCSVMSNPCMHAAISMNHHAPMFVLLLLAWSIVPESNKHICFRQHHILMYNWNSSKERKYLIIKLTRTSSSNSSLYSCCTCGCNYRWDVLISAPLFFSFLFIIKPSSSNKHAVVIHLSSCASNLQRMLLTLL